MAQIKASEVIREAQRLIDTYEKAKLGGRVDRHKYFYVKHFERLQNRDGLIEKSG